jgi:hypothetical protein
MFVLVTRMNDTRAILGLKRWSNRLFDSPVTAFTLGNERFSTSVIMIGSPFDEPHLWVFSLEHPECTAR